MLNCSYAINLNAIESIIDIEIRPTAAVLRPKEVARNDHNDIHQSYVANPLRRINALLSRVLTPEQINIGPGCSLERFTT